MLPWTDYSDASYVDLYDPTGTYITYYLACKYVHGYPSHWSWLVYQRSYDWTGAATDEERYSGREGDRITAKREGERWFRENVGEVA